MADFTNDIYLAVVTMVSVIQFGKVQTSAPSPEDSSTSFCD